MNLQKNDSLHVSVCASPTYINILSIYNLRSKYAPSRQVFRAIMDSFFSPVCWKMIGGKRKLVDKALLNSQKGSKPSGYYRAHQY